MTDSGVSYFLKNTLGEDFLESLGKSELWKPGTKSTLDHEEIRTALQIVPRTIMALLIRELAPMDVGQNKSVNLFVAGNATLSVTKHERDVYSGDIVSVGRKLTEFKFRSLPGIGLVILSTFELYDMENLINAPSIQAPIVPSEAPIQEDMSAKIQKLIDDRLALHDLIGKVVDKKIMEKEAVHQLVMRKLTEMMDMKREPEHVHEAINVKPKDIVKKETSSKKRRPLTEFLEKSKKKHEYSVVMAKGENVHCDTCGKAIFNDSAYSGCICMGENMDSKIFIKKEVDGVKIRFPKSWDKDNIEMLLEMMRRKNG